MLVVDKPAGMTSHDVVDEVRKRLGTRKVGHAGTLDPDATGLLILGIGSATRLLSVIQGAPKTYMATVRFGVSTSTQDASGEVIEERSASHVSEAAIRSALDRFVGDIEQIPPMVSAIKVGGERLYAKARRGEDVERPARRITVYRMDVTSFTGGDAPEATLEVECSAGTYVRTLAHDLGAALGCGAHLSFLRRTAAGGFVESDAVPLDEVDAARLRPIIDAVRSLPSVEVDDEQARLVGNGRPLEAERVRGAPDEGGLAALVHRGRLVALYERKGNELRADRVIPA